MTTTGTGAESRLITPQLEEMLKLIGDADSVELKLTVPDEDRQSAVAALGIDPLDAVRGGRRAPRTTTS